MMVENGDLSGEARGFSTLAGLYEESGQIIKAHEYYKKVSLITFVTHREYTKWQIQFH